MSKTGSQFRDSRACWKQKERLPHLSHLLSRDSPLLSLCTSHPGRRPEHSGTSWGQAKGLSLIPPSTVLSLFYPLLVPQVGERLGETSASSFYTATVACVPSRALREWTGAKVFSFHNTRPKHCRPRMEALPPYPRWSELSRTLSTCDIALKLRCREWYRSGLTRGGVFMGGPW